MPQHTATVDAESAARLRRIIANLSRHLNAPATGAALTPTQTSVLATVALQGPLRLSDLAAHEHLNPTMLSRVVGKLADAGLITREPTVEDRRAARATVTDEGRRLLQRIRDERTSALTAGLEQLPVDQAAAVLAALPGLETLALAMRDH